MSDLTGKTVFLAGGSTGLGKELAIALASRDPEKIQSTFASQSRLPDILYCLAGGTTNELGFLVDLDPSDVQRCMTNNYLTSAYPAQAILKLWIQDDKQKKSNPNVKGSVKRRKLVFISSAAAFVAFPGYIAYTHLSAAKCAVRALADTLRSELKRYSGPVSEYSVHISFPSNFISPSFIDELGNKPELTKQLDGTAAPMTELTQKLHSSKQVADYILKEVDKN
ncbi:short chain dehydrogenase reductase family oxidoreductase, partial [Fusarium denticulatum]